MATYTDNYNLKMPSGQDAPNVEDFNGNAEIIDAALKGHDNDISSLNSSLTSLQSQSLIPRDAPKISANDILQSGIYRLNGDITDVNNNNNGILIHLMCGDATNIRLQFICRYDGELCRIRTYWYGTWSAWKEL